MSARLQATLDGIVFARDYTCRLIDTFPADEWFRVPAGVPTHLAWQVGHLAMAQYRLALERIRGSRPEDAGLISEAFLKRFGRESVADPDPASNPPPDEIRATYDRVHAQVLRELPGMPEADLDLAPHRPHPLASTRIAALMWCGHHEMLHAGQIGLLRRLFGKPPLW